MDHGQSPGTQPAARRRPDNCQWRYRDAVPRIDAEVVSLDRRKVIYRMTKLSTLPRRPLEIRGEDIRSSPVALSWPDREMGSGTDMAGGSPIYRCVYLAGESPQLS